MKLRRNSKRGPRRRPKPAAIEKDEMLRMPKDVRHRKEEYFRNFDIVQRAFKMSEKVCVLAPGLNAAVESAYEHITADFIIAVNGAALIPLDKKIDMWLVTDNECLRARWFEEADKRFEGIKCFSTWVCNVALPMPYICNMDKFYTVSMYGRARLDGITFIPLPNKFRPDITVVGTAMRIAQLCGAKCIELCGVDMFGDLYYDGRSRHLPQYADKPLDSRDRLDSAIRWMREQGVEIESLSTTALETL